jgi:predicted permease
MKLPRWLQWRSSQELDEEIAAHLELATQTGVDRGLTPEEARYAALRGMGNATRVQERAREGDPLFWIGSLAKDVRYALRSLRRNPAFTAAAVLSLALGIGVNSAVFSFTDGLLLRPMDVPHASRLVQVHARAPQYGFSTLSYREYTELRDHSTTLEGLAAEKFQVFAEQDDDNQQARFFFGDLVSGNFLSVLGVAPMLGRSFLAEEDSPAAKDIPGLLDYQSWQIKFHSDPRILGAKIKLNGQFATIVGVLPEEFRGTDNATRPEIYAPLAATPKLFPGNSLLADATSRDLLLWGALKPGVGVHAAEGELANLEQRVEKAFPNLDRQRIAIVLPERDSRIQQSKDTARLVYILLVIAGLVLLVACVNVANLLLARASARVREITIRRSVGASRGRLIGQLLTESVVLAVLGAGAGLLLAQWAIHFFASIRIPSDIPVSIRARMDGRVLGYSAIAMAASVVLFGLWPAFRVTRADLVSPIKGATDLRSEQWFRGRDALVAIQTALATMLLVSAALFVTSLIRSRAASPGFRVGNVLTMSFNPGVAGYTDARIRTFYKELEDRVSNLPGVRSAALGSHIPMGDGQWFQSFAPETGAEGGQTPLSAMFSRVEPAYFATMGVPILEGRPFDDRDRLDAPAVAVVNRALAQRFWPNRNAVGQRIRFGRGPTSQVLEVVGVAEDGKYQESIDEYEPYVYVPYRQQYLSLMSLFIHTEGDPAAMAPAIREVLKGLGQEVPVFGVRTMKEIFEGHGLLASRLMAQTVGAMGAIGLALGVLGLYAVVAFSVTRRTREIGIRMALGARPEWVLRSVLASGVKVTLAGIAIGTGGALALTRYFANYLDRVNPRDPAAFFGVPILLMLAAIAACWVPARRAASVDPAVTLKYE